MYEIAIKIKENGKKIVKMQDEGINPPNETPYTEKVAKFPEKTLKKGLTKLQNGVIISKLTRESTAPNLENDTEYKITQTERQIPNEFASWLVERPARI